MKYLVTAICLLGGASPGLTQASRADAALQTMHQAHEPSTASTSPSRSDLVAQAVQLERDSARAGLDSKMAIVTTSMRKADVFGLPVRGDVLEPPEPIRATGLHSPLFRAVRAMRIVGINPSAGEIYIGSKTLRRDNVIILRFEGGAFRLRILSISPQAVLFESLETGEKVSTALDLIPPLSPQGMQPLTAR